jgi:ureidoglycolate hydrolase
MHSNSDEIVVIVFSQETHPANAGTHFPLDVPQFVVVTARGKLKKSAEAVVVI